MTTGKAFATTESSPNSINFSVIKEYAGFSNATYKTETQIREFSSLKKYTLTHYSNIPEIEISYFLATNDTAKTQIIAVRGTSNIENAIVDIALKLTPDKLAGVRIHNGFSQAAQAIYKEIKPQLKTDYVISTTGHSLGGAVALILAMYLDIDKFNIGQVITFGQPKVTNIGGANKFQGLNIIRVVTPKDLVPLVPPLDPVDINNIDIYWHLGKEVLLLPENTYAILEGMSSMLRATRFTQEPLNENNLANHQMSLYLQLIDKKITHSKQVPFKNSLNLFNLFGSEEK
ncbi:MAG TPA: lipase family protein [Gammaproteobacteria bacterium]